ncbi:hypothetical protein AAC387_Pa08g2093 [Persea americana]
MPFKLFLEPLSPGWFPYFYLLSSPGKPPFPSRKTSHNRRKPHFPSNFILSPSFHEKKSSIFRRNPSTFIEKPPNLGLWNRRSSSPEGNVASPLVEEGISSISGGRDRLLGSRFRRISAFSFRS